MLIILKKHVVCKVKLVILVEGDRKVPSSLATTPRYREGPTQFPRLRHFTLDPYVIMLSGKQSGIKYYF